VLNGITSLTCGEDGNWTSDVPTCLKLRSTLTPPANGACDPKNCSGVVGDQVEFKCNKGFEINGSAILRCSNKGSWSNDVPFCSGKCMQPIDQCKVRFYNL